MFKLADSDGDQFLSRAEFRQVLQNFIQIPYMTAFQNNHSFWFQKPMKVKVVKWGKKKWNEHDLMHIYHKQCEIIQKIEWNSSNDQIHYFHYMR